MKEPIKLPTLQQKLDQVRAWYVSFSIVDCHPCSMTQMANFLVQKGLCIELGTALKYLASVFKISNVPAAVAKGKVFTFDHFNKLFLLPLFRESLI